MDMTNHHDTAANQSSSDGQQPHNPNPQPPSTEQVNVGGVPPVVRELSLTLNTVPNRGPSVKESSTPAKDSPSGRRRSPPTGRGLSSTKMSPPSGRGSPSSGGRGSPSSSVRGLSSASPNFEGGKISQIGGRNFTPVSADISLRGGSTMTAAGSMIPIGASPQRVKRKADVKAPEGMIPVCTVCKRSDFSSWKALFGHLRSHPERQWRGCFPPPGSQEAQQLALQQQGGGAVRGFDLNEVSDLEEEFGEGSGIDLNMPPADDDDENDEGGGGDGSGSVATDRD